MTPETRKRIDTLLSDLRAKLSDGEWQAGGWRTDPLKREFDGFLEGIDPPDWAALFNELAVDVSRQFLAGDIDFDFADDVINQAYDVALSLEHDAYTYPGFFDSIYQAFDDGEWHHHGKTDDPVADFTIPQLQHLIKDLEQP